MGRICYLFSLIRWTRKLSVSFAVPTDSSNVEQIDIFHLPSTHRLSTIAAPKSITSGILMALWLNATPERTCVVAGYESGHVAYFLNTSRTPAAAAATGPAKSYPQTSTSDSARPLVFSEPWQCIYLSRPHTQPVLSLGLSPDDQFLMSSGADSIIATHDFLSVITPAQHEPETIEAAHALQKPFSAVKTGHPGQQGLSVSEQGNLFATAGWDGVARLYSWPDALEREILEWHREGTYASAFAHVLGQDDINGNSESKQQSDLPGGTVAVRPTSTVQRSGTLALRRERQAQTTPWLALGGKDGKISLWAVPES